MRGRIGALLGLLVTLLGCVALREADLRQPGSGQNR